MDNIQTLTHLLKNSGCEYKIFDLGRRILPVEQTLFASVELGQQPYPYPLQRQANIAISYWNAERQPWIWFLKFPLDERGLLKQSDIGNFIKYVVEAMGTRLGGQLSQEQQQTLANNPYTFKPSEDKMAVFHSQIRFLLDMPTSQYYEHAQHYFTGDMGWANWQTVGLQGIADICTRLNQEQNGVIVRKAIRHIPNEPQYALLGVLEHTSLPGKLSTTIYELAQKECESTTPDLFLLSAQVRALAGGSTDHLYSLVKTILSSAKLSHQEVLIGIAGRSWQVLQDPTIAEHYLLRLAQTGNQELFNQIFSDLVMLPALRLILLPLLHSNPSDELASALLKLQQSTKSKAT
ncbi:DUF3549 family protein [Vibrio sp. TH_r3]|uniref:DUF3549 family protein n=1 Tax=Vibrio sp. TH_r3 TaxID=3082084 RepID=UPI002952A86F|nr:DUF3549 family protein [Vibrio sp. TH_r3]MDV7105026.1 DUF3549 family protein [Vibrio sp. TH_r3]